MPLRLIKLACRVARRTFGSPAVHVTLTLADGRRCEYGCAPEPLTPRPKARTKGPTALVPSASLGTDARKIVDAIQQRGPIEAKNIPSASGVERSKCYVLIGDLAERGLIRDTPDGYVVVAN